MHVEYKCVHTVFKFERVVVFFSPTRLPCIPKCDILSLVSICVCNIPIITWEQKTKVMMDDKYLFTAASHMHVHKTFALF